MTQQEQRDLSDSSSGSRTELSPARLSRERHRDTGTTGNTHFPPPFPTLPWRYRSAAEIRQHPHRWPGSAKHLMSDGEGAAERAGLPVGATGLTSKGSSRFPPRAPGSSRTPRAAGTGHAELHPRPSPRPRSPRPQDGPRFHLRSPGLELPQTPAWSCGRFPFPF